MSKKSRAKAKKLRANKRRAHKQAQQMQYQAWAREGNNKKSKRSVLRNRRTNEVTTKHSSGPCGNIGCSRCQPNTPANNPWLAPTGSCIWSKQFTSSKFAKMVRT